MRNAKSDSWLFFSWKLVVFPESGVHFIFEFYMQLCRFQRVDTVQISNAQIQHMNCGIIMLMNTFSRCLTHFKNDAYFKTYAPVTVFNRFRSLKWIKSRKNEKELDITVENECAPNDWLFVELCIECTCIYACCTYTFRNTSIEWLLSL